MLPFFLQITVTKHGFTLDFAGEITVAKRTFRPLSADGVLVLGQDQDSPGAYFDQDQVRTEDRI